MKDLITISQSVIGNGEVNSVLGSELHAFLEVQTKFSDWIERRISEYDFLINSDFCSFLSRSSGGRKPTDYSLSMDMAKELSMVEKNAKGKEARRYFIQKEKEANSLQRVPDLQRIVTESAAKRALLKDCKTNAGSLGLKGWRKTLMVQEMARMLAEGSTASYAEMYEIAMHPANPNRNAVLAMCNAWVEPIRDPGTGIDCYYVEDCPPQFVPANQLEGYEVEGYSNDDLLVLCKMQVPRRFREDPPFLPTERGRFACIGIYEKNRDSRGGGLVELRWREGVGVFLANNAPYFVEKVEQERKATEKYYAEHPDEGPFFDL